MPNPRFLFICGLHRSGTSLLQRLLSAHPDISGFANTGVPQDEGQHLQTVYPPGRAFGGPGKFAFAPQAHLTEASPLVTDANRRKLFQQWSRYWDLSSPVLLEKSPPNLIRSRFLQAMFPESHFIFIVRHPVAVAIATQKWAKSSLPELVGHWAQAHRIMFEDMPHLGQALLLRYEDFVASPASCLKRIYEALSLPFMPPEQAISDRLNEGYFSAWEAHAHAGEVQPHAELAARFGYRFDAPYVEDYK